MRDLVMRIVALALLGYSLFGFAAALRQLESCAADKSALEARCEAIRQANRLLSEKIETAGTPQGMESLARERLALVMPGEKIFVFHETGEEALWSR